MTYIFGRHSAREKNTLFYEEKEKCVLKLFSFDAFFTPSLFRVSLE